MGTSQGAAQKKVYAFVGAAAAIAAAVGPLIGGFITTYLSWRVAFGLEVVVIAIVLSGIKLVHDVPVHRARGRSTRSVRSCPSWGWGGSFSASWSGRRVASPSSLLLAAGGVSLGSLVYWLKRRKREDKPTLLDPDLFQSQLFRYGISGQMLQQIAPRRHDDRAADLPADGAGVQRDGGGPLPRAAVAEHVRDRLGRRANGPASRRPASVIRLGFVARVGGCGCAAADRAAGDLRLVPGGPAADRRSGPGAAGLPAEQLHPLADHRGQGQRGRRSQLGGRLLRALVRACLCRRDHAGDAVLRLHQPGRGQRCARPRGSSSRSRPLSRTTRR